MIEINITLLIQLVNFIIALAVMNILLIRPVRAIVRERRTLASGLLGDTERFAADATERLARYEAALAAARDEAAKLREADKTAALARETRILADAQKDAQDFLRASRESTRNAVAGAMDDMRGRIPALAGLAAETLLGRPSSAKPEN